MQDECHRFHMASAHLTVACAFSDQYTNSQGIISPAGFEVLIIIAFRWFSRGLLRKPRDTGSFTLDNSRVLAFRAGCETERA